MRKSILIFCGLALVVCLWLLLHRPAGTTVNGSLPSAEAATNRNLVASSKPAMTSSATNVSQPVANAPNQHRTNEPSTINATVAELWQKPIDFYGKVVDENTNAVAGANIEFRWDDLTAKDWTRATNAISDVNGLFSLHGKRGATLTVSVNKAGYYSSPKDTDSFHYGVPNDNQPYTSDQWNPAIFHLRKKGQGVELVTSKNGMRTELATLVPVDGHPARVDLLEKKVISTGDLELSQIKPDRSHWQMATNWSLHMSIPTGGFIEAKDAFLFTAPGTGYQTTIDLNFVKGEPNWTTQIDKTYYIKFGQPHKYGWLQVKANIAQQTVFLKFAINPYGSRNLEPK